MARVTATVAKSTILMLCLEDRQMFAARWGERAESKFPEAVTKAKHELEARSAGDTNSTSHPKSGQSVATAKDNSQHLRLP